MKSDRGHRRRKPGVSTPPPSPVAARGLKACERVALDIVRDIVAQRLEPGDGLPSEAQMLEGYHTSRFTLREALRLLEVQGLIRIRRGRGNSTSVGQPGAEHLARTLTLHLHLAGATFEQLLAAWEVTEPLLAEFAARNPDRARVAELLSPFLGESAHRRDEWPVPEGVRFHELVAQLADNPVLSLSFASIAAIQTLHVLNTTPRNRLEPYIIHDHAGIAHAIIAGRPVQARKLMQEHVRHIIGQFQRIWPHQVGERIRLG